MPATPRSAGPPATPIRASATPEELGTSQSPLRGRLAGQGQPPFLLFVIFERCRGAAFAEPGPVRLHRHRLRAAAFLFRRGPPPSTPQALGQSLVGLKFR